RSATTSTVCATRSCREEAACREGDAAGGGPREGCDDGSDSGLRTADPSLLFLRGGGGEGRKRRARPQCGAGDGGGGREASGARSGGSRGDGAGPQRYPLELREAGAAPGGTRAVVSPGDFTGDRRSF